MNIPGMKARYLRLDRFIRMVDSLGNQSLCPVCREMTVKAQTLAERKVRTKTEYQEFEKEYMTLFGEMVEHLKVHHGYRLPNYFLSLYTMIYMLVGALAGLFIIYLGRVGRFGHWNYEIGGLLGFVVGLIIGRISGHRKDKEMRLNKKNLY